MAVGCAGPRGAAPPAEPAPGDDVRPRVEVYEAVARDRLARDGLDVGRVVVVQGEAWDRAAEGAATLAQALVRVSIPGVVVEPRAASFCARSRAGGDCLFVSVVAADGRGPPVDEIDPARVEAVVFVAPAPPVDGDRRMAWREELRTGRLLVFVTTGGEVGLR